ncbi:MAG: hypothetical protein INR70_37320 [Parafilimonas terrae]|nr:hypothetical protein [Parafilimonas terrae]
MRTLLSRKVSAETVLQDLETRRSGVVRRLEAAGLRADEAIANQRSFLVETNGEDAATAKRLADACRRTSDERAALEDAANVLAGQIAEAKTAIDIERDRRARTEVASEIDADATAIEAAAAELSRAAAAFDLAREALERACGDHAPKGHTGFDQRHLIIDAAKRQAGLLPRTTQEWWTTLHLDAVPAAAEVVKPMRDNAKAIREGATPMPLAQKSSAPLMPIPYPMARVCLAQPAFYRGFLGHRIDLFPGNVEAPEMAVQTAIAKGIGFTPSSAAGQLITRTIQIEPNARFELDDTGGLRTVKFAGPLGEGGKGLPPAPPPVDLGTMPDTLSVTAEAAQ